MSEILCKAILKAFNYDEYCSINLKLLELSHHYSFITEKIMNMLTLCEQCIWPALSQSH